MNSPSASFSVTMRVVLDDARTISAITTVNTDAGGGVITLDVVDSHAEELVFDVTCTAIDELHVTTLRATVDAVGGARVRALSARTMLVHLGGLITVTPTVPLKTRDDLSLAYTPGVARVCQAIAADPAAERNLTIKRNTVAVGQPDGPA